LVLADEPTGNLDLETGLQVLDLLDRLTRRAGKTMVMVTHSPEMIGLADRVLRIESCRLVERMSAAEAEAQEARRRRQGGSRAAGAAEAKAPVPLGGDRP
jgi:ABC-type lipoprotein export system ATPase subunit